MLLNLKRMFIYNDWANQELLDSLIAQKAPQRAFDVMAHIVAAEKLWLERLRPEGKIIAVWPKYPIQDMRAQLREMFHHWLDLFNRIKVQNLHDEITYTNTQGVQFTNTVGDILTHVVMHSAYHRGQVATLLRQEGRTPPNTDYIHAIRQEFVE